MDPFERSEVGGLHGITERILEERDQIVFEWCSSQKLPIAFVLARGLAHYLGENEDLVEADESEMIPMVIGDLCPDCGAASMVNEEGCRKCYSCGFSEC